MVLTTAVTLNELLREDAITEGTMVVCVFADEDNTEANGTNALSGASDFATVTGSVLTLVRHGAGWVQVSRTQGPDVAMVLTAGEALEIRRVVRYDNATSKLLKSEHGEYGSMGVVPVAVSNNADGYVQTAGVGYFEAAMAVRKGKDLKVYTDGKVGEMAPGASVQIAEHAQGAFTNQPANDGVELVSSDAADTTQTVTVWYVRNGALTTLVSEAVALNGTTQVALTHTDVEYVLGVELSAACAGTVTVREASGNATITTLAPAATTSGLLNIATTYGYATVPDVYGDNGGSTGIVGLVGNDGTSATANVATLSGTAKVAVGTTRLWTCLKLLTGNASGGTNVLLASSSTADNANLRVGTSIAGSVSGGSMLGLVRD
jgi:hypothetical protein